MEIGSPRFRSFSGSGSVALALGGGISLSVASLEPHLEILCVSTGVIVCTRSSRTSYEIDMKSSKLIKHAVLNRCILSFVTRHLHWIGLDERVDARNEALGGQQRPNGRAKACGSDFVCQKNRSRSCKLFIISNYLIWFHLVCHLYNIVSFSFIWSVVFDQFQR